jgi:hypothetical protein
LGIQTELPVLPGGKPKLLTNYSQPSLPLAFAFCGAQHSEQVFSVQEENAKTRKNFHPLADAEKD